MASSKPSEPRSRNYENSPRSTRAESGSFVPDRYTPQVIDHLVRPRNVGEIGDPSGSGESGHEACGDVASFTVGISDNVLDALHKAFEDHWNRTAGEMLLNGDRTGGGGGKSVVAAMSGGVDSAVTAL